jgi:hypothetical protein
MANAAPRCGVPENHRQSFIFLSNYKDVPLLRWVNGMMVSVEREGAMKLLIVCAAILMAFAILRPAQAHRMTTLYQCCAPPGSRTVKTEPLARLARHGHV